MATITVSNTSQLQAALKNAKGGDTILMNGGDYDPLSVSNIKFSSMVTLKAADTNNPPVFHKEFDWTNCENIRIDGIEFDGGRSSPYDDGDGGVVNIEGVKGFELVNSEFYHAGQAFRVRESSDILVDNNYVHDGKQGGSFFNVDNFIVSNNVIERMNPEGMQLGSVTNGQIIDNYLSDFTKHEGQHPDFIQFYEGSEPGPEGSHDILVSGNVMIEGENGTVQGIFISTGSAKPYYNFTIENNIYSGSAKNGIQIQNTNNSIVQNNTLINNGNEDQPVIMLRSGTSNITIKDNVTPGVGQASGGNLSNQNVSGNVIVNMDQYSSYFVNATKPNPTIEDLAPKPGSAIDKDGVGAYDRFQELLNGEAPNKAPIAGDDIATGNMATAISINALSNDSDPDGSPISITTFTQGANGSVVKNANGTFTYTGKAGFAGTDTFTYTVTDGEKTDTATVTVTVKDPNNKAPVAANDTVTMDEDTSKAINVLINDTDPEGNPLTLLSVGTAANGTVVKNSDGTVTYTPKANFFGNDSFTYQVTDGRGGVSTATVNVTVNDVAEPAVTGLGLFRLVNTTTDTTVDSSFMPGDSIASTIAANPLGVVVDLNASHALKSQVAKVSFNLDNGAFVRSETTAPYALFGDQGEGKWNEGQIFTAGQHTLLIQYLNSSGAVIASDTINFTVGGTTNPNNKAPVAANDTLTIAEDAAATKIAVLANDSDPDGDTLSIGTVTNGAKGTVTKNSDGTLSYTANANATGTDSFTYQAIDGKGGVTTATVNVNITPVNDNPTAKADTVSAKVGTAMYIDVLANDTDIDGDALSITSVGTAAHGKAQISDGAIAYTPTAGYTGTDTFTYTVSDGKGGTSTASVTVNIGSATNTNPDAVNDSATAQSGIAKTINVLANDTDANGDVLSITSVGSAANGTVTKNSDGTISYVSKSGFSGNDSFTYTVSDGKGGTDTATVNVTVQGTTTGTVYNVSNATGLRDAINKADTATGPVTIILADGNYGDLNIGGRDFVGVTIKAANQYKAIFNEIDIDDSSNITIDGVKAPVGFEIGSGGVAWMEVRNSSHISFINSEVTKDAGGALVLDDLRSTRAFKFVESDNILLENNKFHGLSNTGSMNNVDDVVVRGNEIYDIREGIQWYGVQDVLIENNYFHDVVRLVSPVVTSSDHPDFLQFNDKAGGYDAGVPYGNALQEVSSNVTIRNNIFNDGDYRQNLDPSLPVSNAPAIFMGDSLDAANGRTFNHFTIEDNFIVSGNANAIYYRGSDGVIQNNTVLTKLGGAHNPVYIDLNGLNSQNNTVINNIANFRYNSSEAPTPQSGRDTNEVHDNQGVNLLDSSSAYYYTKLFENYGLGANDLSALISKAGSLIAGKGAEDILKDFLDGGFGDTEGNHAPDAVNDSATTTGTAPITISALANDADSDGDAISISTFTQGANGAVVKNANGTFTYTAKSGFVGTDTFTYTITDGDKTDTATVSVKVQGPQVAPDAVNDNATVVKGQQVTIDALANDTDANGDTLSITGTGTAAHGTVSIVNGKIVYKANADYTGNDSFTYNISDGKGGVDTATVNVTVNDTPTVPSLGKVFIVDTDTNLKVGANLADGASVAAALASHKMSIVVEPNTGASFAKVRFIFDGQVVREEGSAPYSMTGDNGPGGLDKILDGSVWSAGAHNIRIEYLNSAGAVIGADDFDFSVAGGPNVNLPPVTVDDTITTAEDTPVTIDVLANDHDQDGGTLSITSAAKPAHGTVAVVNGKVVYTADQNYNGADSFTYTVSDGQGSVNTGKVNVNVTAVNDLPTAVADSAIATTGKAVKINVLANDTDIDGDTLSVSTFGQGANGTVTKNTDGTLSYVSKAGFSGNDSFTYTTSDGKGGTATATVNVKVDAIEPLVKSLILLKVYDTDTKLLIGDLSDGASISSAIAAGQRLTIVADVNPAHELASKVSQLKFDLDDGSYKRTEKEAPFVLFGDNDGIYKDGKIFALGEHNLEIKVLDSRGKVIDTSDVDFTINNKPTTHAQPLLANLDDTNDSLSFEALFADDSNVSDVVHHDTADLGLLSDDSIHVDNLAALYDTGDDAAAASHVDATVLHDIIDPTIDHHA